MTTGNAVDKRHVSAEGFSRYLDSRVPVVLPIRGTPRTFVFIEPLKPELGLRVEVLPDTEAPRTGLRNVISRVVVRDGKWFLEVVVIDPALYSDAYPVLCSMADRVQIGGLSATSALRATLDKMSSLLNPPDSISREREIGLFGELLVMSGLVDVLGVDDAVRTWRGGLAEEHDFGLPGLDVEVKTTTSERRVHWIESLTQLVPTRDRSLWLVSQQLTTAGAAGGRTLPELVDFVRDDLGSGSARDAFEKILSGTGWREEDRDQLHTHWTRRTASTAYAVVGTFPRLTPETLLTNGLPLERFPEVRYRVDLDGLVSQQDIPDAIAAAIGFEGWT